jgi:hypothetical protein
MVAAALHDEGSTSFTLIFPLEVMVHANIFPAGYEFESEP